MNIIKNGRDTAQVLTAINNSPALQREDLTTKFNKFTRKGGNIYCISVRLYIIRF
jgi:hypothetical protein